MAYRHKKASWPVSQPMAGNTRMKQLPAAKAVLSVSQTCCMWCDTVTSDQLAGNRYACHPVDTGKPRRPDDTIAAAEVRRNRGASTLPSSYLNTASITSHTGLTSLTYRRRAVAPYRAVNNIAQTFSCLALTEEKGAKAGEAGWGDKGIVVCHGREGGTAGEDR